MPEPEPLIRNLPWRMIVLLAVLMLVVPLLVGCSETRSQSASVSRTTGTQGGQPVDTTTVTKSQAVEQTQADVGPAVRAAVAAATGDLVGAVKTLTDRPQFGPDQAANLFREISADSGGIDGGTGAALGGAGGALLLYLREYLAHRRTQRSDDEAWDEIKKTKNEGTARG